MSFKLLTRVKTHFFFAEVAVIVHTLQNFQTRKRQSKPSKFIIHDSINYVMIVLFPMHQPAPASTSPGLTYTKLKFRGEIMKINRFRIGGKMMTSTK